MLPQKNRLGNLDPSRATGLMSITAAVHTQSPPATMMLSPYNRRVFRKARFSVIVNSRRIRKGRDHGSECKKQSKSGSIN